MALIKPRSRGKRLVRHRTRLDHETNETLYAYAPFMGESTEYVLNQVIDHLPAKDKELLQWRAANPDSYAPMASSTERRTRRRRANARRPWSGSVQHCGRAATRVATMVRTLLHGRSVLALMVVAVVGTCGLHAFPVQMDEPFLALIAARRTMCSPC